MSEVVLTPDPAQMHIYLDKWVSHIEEAKREYSTRIKVLNEEIVTLRRDKEALRSQMETRVGPLERQISEQNSRINSLLQDIDGYSVEIARIKNRLAGILEEQVSPSTTVDRLVSDVVILVDESKRKLRENL